MGISTKNKRRIVYHGVDFFWWVLPEFDAEGNMLRLTISSADKKFLIQYFPFRADPSQHYIKVVGNYFPGHTRKKCGHFERVECPPFKSLLSGENGITSRLVKEILDWCFTVPR